MVIGRCYEQQEPLFLQPCNSTLFGIYKVSKLGALRAFYIDDIKEKLVRLGLLCYLLTLMLFNMCLKYGLKKFKIRRQLYLKKKQLCWFPFTKADFPNTKVHFKTDQIHKMIRKCYVPNNTDGTWFKCEQIAGPFDSEMRSRMIAKAWSDESQSCDASEDSTSDDNNTVKNGRGIRHKKKPKCYSPPTFKLKAMPVKTFTDHDKQPILIKTPSPPSTPLADHSNTKKVKHHAKYVKSVTINANEPNMSLTTSTKNDDLDEKLLNNMIHDESALDIFLNKNEPSNEINDVHNTEEELQTRNYNNYIQGETVKENLLNIPETDVYQNIENNSNQNMDFIYADAMQLNDDNFDMHNNDNTVGTPVNNVFDIDEVSINSLNDDEITNNNMHLSVEKEQYSCCCDAVEKLKKNNTK
ncbi:GATA zinc finger domain-containing protein 4-like [Acyrthosiphon pisum]|uniref:Uncharacterized protein n=1 Tax=Acyrthosiphon pisum TaxID=7029 RepID=A0A8R2JVL9_ACYPI|nr:GATA zinc finger domain-containing protein 4-like [Acyrthosiphon pisum]